MSSSTSNVESYSVRLRDPVQGGVDSLDRDHDQYGGKKRKVPAYPHLIGRHGDQADHREKPLSLRPPFKSPVSPSAHICLQRKNVFLRRKAGLLTLYLDAQTAVKNKSIPASSIPDVPVFEKILPALDQVGFGAWPPDRPGWRNGVENDLEKPAQRVTHGRNHRRWKPLNRQPVERGGWAPEGSFEFEAGSKASVIARQNAKDRAILEKLADDLRRIVISCAKSTTTTVPMVQTSDVRTSDAPPEATPTNHEDEMVTKTKTKKKKKKRSALANQGNPHHVDNYRPSRTVSPTPDGPPVYSSLMFPAPMKLYAASQEGRRVEDNFMCCFCEMSLFFGTEASRRRAIRRLKAEQRRKIALAVKAKNVAEGRPSHDDDDEESEYEDDDDMCHEDGDQGRCSCGRPIAKPHLTAKTRLKPPDPDPPEID